MSWPLQDDFKPGAPMVQVPMDWFNTVSKILNYIEGSGCKIDKTATPGSESPWRISIPSTGGGSSSELSDEDPVSDAYAASPGESTTASRSDHAHPLNVGSDTPAAVASSGSAGTSSHYARADHVHAGIGALSSTAPADVAGSAAVGTGTTAARADHVHKGLQLTSSAPPAVASISYVGSSTAAARADHTHAGVISAGTTDTPASASNYATLALPDGTKSVGTPASRVYANADHVHPANVGSDTPLADRADGAAGSSLVYARKDHAHILNAGASGGGDGSDYPGDIAVDPDNELSSGVIGSSARYARADHIHRCDGCSATSDPTTSHTDVSTGTTEPATNNSTTWSKAAGGTNGVTLTVVVGVFYDHTATTPQLVARTRILTFNALGQLTAMAAGTSYVVDQPTLITWST